MEFEFGFGSGAERRRGGTGPMRILIIGDFSGRGSCPGEAPSTALADRPVRPVDVDSFEDTLWRLAPSLQLPVSQPRATDTTVDFRELGDFHPDALYTRLGVFKQLRELRGRLLDPATFPAAAEEVRSIAQALPLAPEEASPSAPQQDGTAAGESDSETLVRLLGTTPDETPSAGAKKPDTAIDQLIRDIVAPHVTPDAAPYQDIYVQAVDQAAGILMQHLLHEPGYQALEASWRSLHRLVAGLETGEELQLHLLDVTKHELLADMQAAVQDLQRSHLYRLLMEREVEIPGGRPWSLLVADFRFGATPNDIGLLAALGAIAGRSGGPFLAEADLSLVRCENATKLPDPDAWLRTEGEPAQAWQALRRSPLASWMGLALPRVLLRQPYGQRSEEIEAFPFEELPAGENHAAFLWGSPAFACAELIAKAFQQRGWSMEPGDLLELDELPAYTYIREGESELLPCAEAPMSERAADAILSRGLIPLLSYRNRNAVRVARFQSIADPPVPLSGPWA